MENGTNNRPLGQPQVFNLNFARPWNVVRPRVFRYMDRKFIDDFFSDGSLRLSSFAMFSQHKDEQRKDDQEGFGIRQGIGNQSFISMVGGRGGDCYILCGSLIHSKSLQEKFGEKNGCFVIEDTINFAAEIARHLIGFKEGLEGFAMYQEDTTIRRDIGNLTSDSIFEKYRQPDGTISMDMLSDVHSNIGGVDEFFVKNISYSHQAEYRLIWSVDNRVSSYIDIKVPNAIQFCRKMD